MPALFLALALQALSTVQERLSGYIEALRAADAALMTGEPAIAREHFERALQLSHRNPTVAYGIACAAARSGQKDSLYWLGRAVDWGWVDLEVARWDPDLDLLRGDPRIDVQLRRMEANDEGAAASASSYESWWRILHQEDPRAHASTVTITPDGQWVVAGYRDGRVLVLDAQTGMRERELVQLDDSVWALAATGDGERIAALSKGGRLVVTSLAASNIRVTDGAVEAKDNDWPFGVLLAWDPLGERLLLADEHGDASLWSTAGDLLARWKVEPNRWDVRAVWSPDGERILTAEGSVVRVRHGRTGEILHLAIRAPAPIVTLALSPDGHWVATGHADGLGVVWDLATGVEFGRRRFVDPFAPEPADEIASIAFSPDGEQLAWTTRQGSHAELTDLATFKLLWQSEYHGAHFGEPMPIAWSPDGARIWYAFACEGGELMTATAHRRGIERCFGLGGVPDFAGDRGAFLCDGAAAVVDARMARMLWRRVEIPGGYLIQAPSRHFTGSFEELPQLTLGTGYDQERPVLEARFVERLFDPKRVRAAQAGIPVVPPKLAKD
jgi:hypothetical protein